MASIFQGVGAATALSSSNSFDTKKLQFSSRRSVPDRKTSFLVVRSAGSNQTGGRADHLVTNAVATKADNPAASTGSKPGDRGGGTALEALRRRITDPAAVVPSRDAQESFLAVVTSDNPLDILVIGGGATGSGVFIHETNWIRWPK